MVQRWTLLEAFDLTLPGTAPAGDPAMIHCPVMLVYEMVVEETEAAVKHACLVAVVTA